MKDALYGFFVGVGVAAVLIVTLTLVFALAFIAFEDWRERRKQLHERGRRR